MSRTRAVSLLVFVLVMAGLGWLSWSLLAPPPTTNRQAEHAEPEDANREQSSHPVAEAADKSLAPTPTRLEPSAGEPDPGERPSTLLLGTLVDPDGEPVEARLSLRPVVPPPLPPADSRSVRCPLGTFAIAGLDPGPWTLTVSASGFRPVKGDVHLVPGEVERLDLVLAPSIMIPVFLVTDDGRPLQEAAAELSHFDALRPFSVFITETPEPPVLPLGSYASASVSGDARFHKTSAHRRDEVERPKGAAGMLELEGDLPVHVHVAYKHVVLASQTVSNEDAVTLVVPWERLASLPATVRMRLLDSRGDPVTKARVDLSDRQSGGGREVDDDGRIVLEDVPPGLLEFSVWSAHGDEHHYLRVEAGAELDLGDLVLSDPVTVEGQLVLESGGVPKRRSLTYRNLDRMTIPQPLDVGSSHSGEEDGSFKMTGLPRGRLLFFVNGKEHVKNPTLIDTRSGDRTGVEIVVRSGQPVTLEPVVSRSEHYLFTILDHDEVPLFSRHIRGPWPQTFQALDGVYTLQVHHGLELMRTLDFEVAGAPIWLRVHPTDDVPVEISERSGQPLSGFLGRAEGDAAVRAAEQIGITLQGKVEGVEERPLDRISVRLTDAEGNRHSSARVENGCFAIPGLAAGSYVLAASGPGYQPAEQDVEVTPEPPIQSLSVELRPSRSLRVFLSSPDGLPLTKALRDETDLLMKLGDAKPTILVADQPVAADARQDRSFASVKSRSWGLDAWDVELYTDSPACVTLVLSGQVFTSEWVDREAEELALVVPRETLLGQSCNVTMRFVDQLSGAPLHPTKVILTSVNAWSSGGARSAEDYDAEGVLTLTDEPAGERALAVSLDGYERLRLELTLEPGESNDLGAIELSPSSSISGLFLDGGGNPVAADFMFMKLVDPSADYQPDATYHRSGKDGAFTYPCGLGLYLMRVGGDEWGFQALELDTTQGPIEDLRIIVDGDQTVVFEASDASHAGVLRIRTLNRHSFLRLSLKAGTPTRTRLVPGSYLVTVETGQGVLEKALTVGAEPVRIRFE